MKKYQEKLLVPVLGSVYSGKSTFLNALLNLEGNILEEGEENKLTTKFGCIIRHNKNIKEPQFYHVNLEKKNNNVIYIENEEKIIGIKNINEEIKKINKEAHKENNFSNLFYILEMNITFYSSFFEEYDLLDIPGLDEAENNYAKKIICCVKENIKFGIYIFNSKYYKDNNIIEIIKDINKECNLQFLNSLIILNKIDEIQNKEKIFNEFKEYLFDEIGENIFYNSNFVVALDSICLKYENNYQFNIEYLLNYYFRVYTQEVKYDPNIEFLNKITALLNEILNTKKSFNFKNLNDFCESMSKKVNADEYEEISKIINELSKKASQINIEFDLDPENEDHIPYIKALYECFKEQLIIIQPSNENEILIEYFSNKKIFSDNNKIRISEDELDEKNIFRKRLLNFFNVQLKNLFQKNDTFIEKYISKADELIKLFFDEEKIRIPILGCYNAGKSSIINSFIGDDLLPVDEDECTRRIIFVRYSKSKEPILFEADLKEENFNLNRYYLIEKKSSISISKKDKIKDFLRTINNKEKSNSKKINKFNSFFVLKTPIKLLDEFNLPDKIKKRIEFIDIPGLNASKNLFKGKEGEALEKIISVSNLFIFVNPIDKIINDESNKIILSNLFKNIKIRTDSQKNIINSCIFLLNKCDLENKINLEDIKIEFGNLLAEEPKLIQIEKYSSLQFIRYLHIKDYYENFDIDKYKKEYYNQYHNDENLESFIYKKVKKLFQKDFNEKKSPPLNSSEINKDYEPIIKCFNKKTKKTDEIISLLNYGKKHIKNSIAYEKSNAKNFLPFLEESIKKANNDLNKTYLLLFNSFLKKDLNLLFNRNNDISFVKKKDLESKREIIDKSIEAIFNQSNLKKLYDETNNYILKQFDDYINKAEQKINEKNNNIDDTLNSFVEIINNKLNDFIKKIKVEFENILNKIKEITKNIDDIIRNNINNEDFKKCTLSYDKYYNFELVLKTGGIAAGFTSLLGVIATELSSAITLGTAVGGLIGFGIGAIIGSIIIGIRLAYKNSKKIENFKVLLNNCKIQYESIFNGIRFKIETKKNELKECIKNTNNNVEKFLNEEISNIPKDQWEEAKKEFFDLVKSFNTIFEVNDVNDVNAYCDNLSTI